ncbi:unnamed protein product [Hydatigera taeniaeformis]|uniref:Rho-GAP domain-containing protein n=1 Tax=Hydatigena taeniaeformis TaxID=6205 RepID=A0A0R3WQF3_HYDTA|nr:unnamed protein product [Hydatigera taeniaeformis]
MNTQLSPPNRKNLLLLLKFLLKVVKHEETSKMSVENLALTLWINLCPTSAITEGISVVTNLLAQAEDLVSGEDNSDATELPSHATAVAAPLRAVQTVCKPQPPDRTYGTRSSDEGGLTISITTYIRNGSRARVNALV